MKATKILACGCILAGSPGPSLLDNATTKQNLMYSGFICCIIVLRELPNLRKYGKYIRIISLMFLSNCLFQMWAILTTFIVVMATFVLTSETISGFRVHPRNREQRETIDYFMKLAGKYNSTDRDVIDAYMYTHPVLKKSELVCFCFLTLDVALRITFCPSICNYFKSAIHISEILALVGDWLDVYIDHSLEHLKSEAGYYLCHIVRFLLVFQVVRLFRLARHIMAFNIMSLSVHSSLPEIGVLFFLLLILMTVFGWLMYIAEADSSDRFESMFAAMYWALVTLTTVGYGDLFPDTIFGHVIACMCAVCGIVILSLPIGVIAASFNTYYGHHKYVSRHIKNHNLEWQMQGSGKVSGKQKF